VWSVIVPTNAQVNVTQYHNHSSRDGLYIDSAFTQSAAANLTRDLNFDGTTPTPTATANNGLLTNLYAYYKLDEASGNALDASGNGRTLTNYGNPIGTTTGVINTSRNFPGNNAYFLL
jgi:hypothetical protein